MLTNVDKQWELINGTSEVLTLGGKTKPYSNVNENEKWFMTTQIYHMIDSFRRMVYHEIMNDFLDDDPKRTVAYRINYSIEKLEGGYLNDNT